MHAIWCNRFCCPLCSTFYLSLHFLGFSVKQWHGTLETLTFITRTILIYSAMIKTFLPLTEFKRAHTHTHKKSDLRILWCKMSGVHVDASGWGVMTSIFFACWDGRAISTCEGFWASRYPKSTIKKIKKKCKNVIILGCTYDKLRVNVDRELGMCLGNKQPRGIA